MRVGSSVSELFDENSSNFRRNSCLPEFFAFDFWGIFSPGGGLEEGLNAESKAELGPG